MENKTVTLSDVKSKEEIRTLIDAANHNLEVMGYTEHGIRHVSFVSRATSEILRELGYDDRTVELGAIAGWVHDIGNAVNRRQHGITGAIMTSRILWTMGMPPEEVALIVGAVGNHEEDIGVPVNPVCAALIIADKSDAHRSRVRRDKYDLNDIHDRVNLSIKKNFITVDKDQKVIRLFIYMNEISSPMEYMQIYMSRLVLCEQAALTLGCTFELIINGSAVNRKQDIAISEEVLKGRDELRGKKVEYQNKEG
ncbi:MAG: phosphohydrolase [Clostridiales bacterium]|nr:phosphohydrolase [Clostridiales bacterium]